MTIALVALCLIIAGLLYLLDQQQKRHEAALVAVLERVRSPELVKPEPKIPDVEDTPAVGWENDAEYWEVKNGGS